MLVARWPLMRQRRALKLTSSCRKDVPLANRMECDYYGAHVTLVDGLISDCGRMVAERTKKRSSRDNEGGLMSRH